MDQRHTFITAALVCSLLFTGSTAAARNLPVAQDINEIAPSLGSEAIDVKKYEFHLTVNQFPPELIDGSYNITLDARLEITFEVVESRNYVKLHLEPSETEVLGVNLDGTELSFSMILVS